MNNQKSYYKSLVLTLVGLTLWVLGLVLAIILGIIFNNNILVTLLIVISLLGFVLLIIDDNVNAIIGSVNKGRFTIFYKYKLYGVPNNSKDEFKISAKDLYLNELIMLQEIDKGIFTTVINNKNLKFDLIGWHNKAYCLYEFFLSVIQLDLSKNNKIKISKTNHININHNVVLKIVYLNGKSKQYYLINKNKTKLSFKFKHRNKVILQTCIRKKINLCDLYYFNDKKRM